jgi:hypothetical protein
MSNVRDDAVVAEQAWNETKADEDPEFIACTRDHQLKLTNAVHDIEEHFDDPFYSTGIVGLEHFEEHVHDILTTQAAAEAAKLQLTEGKQKIEDAKTKREHAEAKDPELKRKREEAEAKDPALKRKREKEEEESAAVAKKRAAAEAKRQAEEDEEDEEEDEEKARNRKR